MNTELLVSSNLNGLARRLVEDNILDEVSAVHACTQSSKKNKTLLAWLIKNKSADPTALAAAAADEFGIPLLDISAFDLSQAPLSLVSEALIEKHDALPLHLRGNQLFIGLKDPTDHEVIDEIAFSSGFHVEPILVAANQLAPAIERAMESTNPAFDEFEDEAGLEDLGYQLQADGEEARPSVPRWRAPRGGRGSLRAPATGPGANQCCFQTAAGPGYIPARNFPGKATRAGVRANFVAATGNVPVEWFL